MRDLRKELDALGDQATNQWRPEVGDVIVGKIVAYDQGPTRYGECQIAVLQEEPTNEHCEVWLGHMVLKNWFARVKPTVGERVAIKRLGDSDKGYKRYNLLIDREELQDSEKDEIPF